MTKNKKITRKNITQFGIGETRGAVFLKLFLRRRSVLSRKIDYIIYLAKLKERFEAFQKENDEAEKKGKQLESALNVKTLGSIFS